MFLKLCTTLCSQAFKVPNPGMPTYGWAAPLLLFTAGAMKCFKKQQNSQKHEQSQWQLLFMKHQNQAGVWMSCKKMCCRTVLGKPQVQSFVCFLLRNSTPDLLSHCKDHFWKNTSKNHVLTVEGKKKYVYEKNTCKIYHPCCHVLELNKASKLFTMANTKESVSFMY